MKYKFNIYWQLQKMPYNQHQEAKTYLPSVLNISVRTFENWMYAKEDNSLEIPLEALILMAQFFRVPLMDLVNIKPIETDHRIEFEAQFNTPSHV